MLSLVYACLSVFIISPYIIFLSPLSPGVRFFNFCHFSSASSGCMTIPCSVSCRAIFMIIKSAVIGWLIPFMILPASRRLLISCYCSPFLSGSCSILPRGIPVQDFVQHLVVPLVLSSPSTHNHNTLVTPTRSTSFGDFRHFVGSAPSNTLMLAVATFKGTGFHPLKIHVSHCHLVPRTSHCLIPHSLWLLLHVY